MVSGAHATATVVSRTPFGVGMLSTMSSGASCARRWEVCRRDELVHL